MNVYVSGTREDTLRMFTPTKQPICCATRFGRSVCGYLQGHNSCVARLDTLFCIAVHEISRYCCVLYILVCTFCDNT